MSLKQWLRLAFSKKASARIPSKRREKVEYSRLESRQMLATFLVNSTVDDASGTVDGLISLREAMIAANTNAPFGDAPAGSANGDVIRFNGELAGQATTLANGQITITDDVVIQGGNSLIDAANSSRIFQVSTIERVSIGRLNMLNGNAPVGGAILTSAGTLSIFESTFLNNTATGTGGGAINNGGVALVYLTNSNFLNNHANGPDGDGGAVYSNGGTTIVTDGNMESNSANRDGGAIYVGSGILQTYDHSMVDNTAGGNGGALKSGGGATVVISDGTISNNSAAVNGGGIYKGPGNLFVRSNTVVSQNTADGTGAFDGGGGIFNSAGNTYVNNAILRQNSTAALGGKGGGIYSASDVVQFNSSVVEANTASGAGGGLHMHAGFALLNQSTFQNNDAGVTLPAAPGNGGAVSSNGTVLMLDSGVLNNRARNEGGGLWLESSGQLFVRDGSRIVNNTGLSLTSLGGGVYSKGYVQAVDSVFSNNRSYLQGGGLFLTGAASSRIIRTNFTNNDSGTEGGGIYNQGFVRITDSEMTQNAVSSDGGAIFTEVGATTLLEDMTFIGNLPNDTN